MKARLPVSSLKYKSLEAVVPICTTRKEKKKKTLNQQKISDFSQIHQKTDVTGQTATPKADSLSWVNAETGSRSHWSQRLVRTLNGTSGNSAFICH